MYTQWAQRLLALSLVTFPITGSTAATPSASQILMENGSPYYIPATATVTSSTPIRWDNPTPTHHTVTHSDCIRDERPCLFNSGAVPPGGQFSIPGLPPGRYPYHCGIHPIMRGLLIVTDDSTTSAPL